MAMTPEEKKEYHRNWSREYAGKKRQDPEWVADVYERRKANPNVKESNRAHQEKRRRAVGVKSADEIKSELAAQFVTKSNEKHNNKYDYSKVVYEGANEKVIIICPQHGEFEQTAQAHMRGQGCSICASEARAKSCRARAEEAGKSFIEKAVVVHGILYDYFNAQYINVHTKLKIGCVIHGTFLQTPAGHLQGQGCPDCANEKRAAFAESKGEQAIALWLDEHSIEFVKQKTFEDCRDKMLLRYDFYLPEYNTLIEFDGQQHYEFVKKFHGTQERFVKCQERDTIKTEYAETNGIHLLRIKYSQEKEIDNILSECIIKSIIT